MVPAIYYLFWVRYHLSRVYSQKKSRLKTKYRPLFPLPPNHTLWIHLTVGPSPLYWLGTGWWCSDPCVLAPLSSFFLVLFPCHLCCSKLALFCFGVCPCLISSCISCYVCHFLWFGFSFLHAIPAADTSCFSLFLFIVLFHISFHTYHFIQKDLGLCGPNNVDWIKRVLGPICLDLLKPFCWRTVFCDRSVFCWRFVFCCRSAFCCGSLSLVLFLSLDLSCSLVFLVGLWALLFIGLSFIWAFLHMGFWVLLLIGLSSSWAFGYGFEKMGINKS